jgi:NAD(P)-dependent dehydrogenase (short-subunit alcohol dehydrogenase family)
MSGVLQGRVAVVTGAGRGLGRTHALALARAGAAVVVNDLGVGMDAGGRDNQLAEAVVAEIEAAGGKAVSDATDVSDWDGAKAIVDTAVSTFGRLDIVVNNAGVSRFAPIDEETGEAWNRVIGINLTGTAAVSHWAGLHWRQAGAESGRAIINTTSPAGTNPLPGTPAYCTSKAGVIALTITSAADLAALGVRVNAIAPIARTRLTEAVPMFADLVAPVHEGFDRIAPEHVSAVVVYLASPACSFAGRVFGIEGDDLFLFSGMSASTHLNNSGEQWTIESLTAALADVDRNDRGYAIAPSTRYLSPQPGDAVLETLAAVERGEAVPSPTTAGA